MALCLFFVFCLSSPIPDYKRRGQALIGDPESLPFLPFFLPSSSTLVPDILNRGSSVFMDPGFFSCLL